MEVHRTQHGNGTEQRYVPETPQMHRCLLHLRRLQLGLVVAVPYRELFAHVPKGHGERGTSDFPCRRLRHAPQEVGLHAEQPEDKDREHSPEQREPVVSETAAHHKETPFFWGQRIGSTRQKRRLGRHQGPRTLQELPSITVTLYSLLFVVFASSNESL